MKKELLQHENHEIDHTHTSMLLLWIKLNSIRTQAYVFFDSCSFELNIKFGREEDGRWACVGTCDSLFWHALNDSDNVIVYEWMLTVCYTLIHHLSYNLDACLDQPTPASPSAQFNAIPMLNHTYRPV